ncbi:16S rRNA (guanine(527)-N(7))-methyltransferase RsmG [Flavobacteriales bacterium]|nr:16S rRNA (guanine(527)-N(7))-methyltransferase RsmG [Flavobacteriales bacterium]
MDIILKYFPNLSSNQILQFESLLDLYASWNAKINVISRKDMDSFYERHVLHSLGIAKVMNFKAGTHVLDVGTGGGFPGIPLAILFPKTNFLLIDSIGKKINVVNDVVEQLQLTNVSTAHQRAEHVKKPFDFVVSRAVTRMPAFIDWIEKGFSKKSINDFPNGILYLKGGDLTEELSSIDYHHNSFDLADYFEEDFFETKKVVYVQMV